MTRRQADLTFEDSRRDVDRNDRRGRCVPQATRSNAALAALAAEQVGGARRLLEMSVEYAQGP